MLPPCEALIDQDVYVGGDSVGHACYRSAKWAVPMGGGKDVLLCDRCREMLRDEPQRLKLRGMNPKARTELFASVISTLEKEVGDALRINR